MTSAYSSEQISEYLDYVQLPQEWHPAAKPALTLEYLHILHVHQISTIPYENLSLHYNVKKGNCLDPQVLFEKFVRRRRGGYCMENSIFYNHILRGLGFQVYTAGVKIRFRKETVPFGPYIGWVHIVNIVTLPDGTKWMIDVGFGGDGATKPVPLVHGEALHNLGTQEIRLIHDNIPEQVDKSRLYWIYQYRNSPTADWNSYYAFPEWEFSEADFGLLNYWTSQCPDSFQTFTMLVVKFLRRGNDVEGKVMLWNNLVKRNTGGKTELLQELNNEAERVRALQKWFGIELTKSEQEGIKGHVTEIK